MVKGKLGAKQDMRQQEVEGVMASLGVALALLDHDRLRLQQAIRRARLDDLLGPVLEDYSLIVDNLHILQAALRNVWEQEQARRWE